MLAGARTRLSAEQVDFVLVSSLPVCGPQASDGGFLTCQMGQALFQQDSARPKCDNVSDLALKSIRKAGERQG